MPSLLRFAGSTERGPSGALWGGIVDWVSGSMVTDLGARDFDDFAPYNAGNETIAGTAGAAATLVAERDGVIGVVNLLADADSPQMFIGLFDGAVTAVFSAGALAVSSNQDMLGLRWNADETIDIVANVDGTLTVLKDDIGVTVERTSGFNEMGLRVENHGGESYRLTPVINGQRRNGVTVDDSAIPESVAMKFTLSSTVAATTNVNFEVDWIYTNDK